MGFLCSRSCLSHGCDKPVQMLSLSNHCHLCFNCSFLLLVCNESCNLEISPIKGVCFLKAMGSRAHVCPCPVYVRVKSEELYVWRLTQLNKGLFWSWLGWAKSCFKMYSLDSPSARPDCAAPSCWSQPSPEAGSRPKLWVWLKHRLPEQGVVVVARDQLRHQPRQALMSLCAAAQAPRSLLLTQPESSGNMGSTETGNTRTKRWWNGRTEDLKAYLSHKGNSHQSCTEKEWKGAVLPRFQP